MDTTKRRGFLASLAGGVAGLLYGRLPTAKAAGAVRAGMVSNANPTPSEPAYVTTPVGVGDYWTDWMPSGIFPLYPSVLGSVNDRRFKEFEPDHLMFARTAKAFDVDGSTLVRLGFRYQTTPYNRLSEDGRPLHPKVDFAAVFPVDDPGFGFKEANFHCESIRERLVDQGPSAVSPSHAR